MKILHIAQQYWPHGGGVEYHLEKLNEQLVADGHTVSVLTLHPLDDTNIPKSEIHKKVTIVRLPQLNLQKSFINSQREKIHRWFSIFRVLAYIRSAHIVHVHDVFWWLLPFFWLIPGKLYITFHGYENEFGPSNSQRRWHRLGEILTDGNITIGGFHTKWYGVTPDIVSYGAIDSAASKKIEPVISVNKKFHIIFIGRLQAHTGAKELVSAVAALPTEIKTNLSVNIYGQGELQQELADIISKENLPIILKGFDPNARSYLANADCICVSQYLALLESLVVEKPIISYAVSDFKEDVLRMTPYVGALTIVRSPEEMAHEIEEIYHAKRTKKSIKLAEMKKAKMWAQSQTWQELAMCYYKLWQLKS